MISTQNNTMVYLDQIGVLVSLNNIVSIQRLYTKTSQNQFAYMFSIHMSTGEKYKLTTSSFIACVLPHLNIANQQAYLDYLRSSESGSQLSWLADMKILDSLASADITESTEIEF